MDLHDNNDNHLNLHMNDFDDILHNLFTNDDSKLLLNNNNTTNDNNINDNTTNYNHINDNTTNVNTILDLQQQNNIVKQEDNNNLNEISITFGRTEPINTISLNPLEFLNSKISPKFNLNITGLPKISRVENQIKINLKISPILPNLNSNLIYLPSDSIAKQKLYLTDDINTFPINFQKKLIYLHCFVLSTNNQKKTTFVCQRCIKRELRRSSRRKSGLSDNILWSKNPNKRAIIFNNKQIIQFKNNKSDNTSNLSLTSRIVCYSRHHDSPDGFSLFFVLLDYDGNILAKKISDPIIIMDKKPSTASNSIQQNSNSSFSNLTDYSISSSSYSTDATNSNTESGTDDQQPQTFYNNNNNNTNVNHIKNPQQFLMFKSGKMIPSPSSMSEDNLDLSRQSFNNNSRTNSFFNNNNNNSSHLNKNFIDNPSINDNNFYNNNNNSPLQNFQASSNPNSPMANVINNFNNNNATSNNTNNNNNNNNLTSTNPNNIHTTSTNFGIDPDQPAIQRAIPSQGPINGGIEITLLGTKFKPGLIVKFGDNIALSTQCWSETTMVTYLPPTNVAGQVFITVFDPSVNTEKDIPPGNKTLFTYVDETDRHLIELALQIVGLKMNGKLEDARNIAKRIVGTDDNADQNVSPNSVGGNNNGPYMNSCNTNNNVTDELLIVHIIESIKSNLNLSMCDKLGRTLLHLAALKGYNTLVYTLIKNGARINDKDSFGFTPLHFACISGSYTVINMLLNCNADHTIKATNNTTPKTLYFLNHANNQENINMNSKVLALFDNIENFSALTPVSIDDRKLSNTSLADMDMNDLTNRSIIDSSKSTSKTNFNSSRGANNNADVTFSLQSDSDYQRSDFEEYGDEHLLSADSYSYDEEDSYSESDIDIELDNDNNTNNNNFTSQDMTISNSKTKLPTPPSTDVIDNEKSSSSKLMIAPKHLLKKKASALGNVHHHLSTDIESGTNSTISNNSNTPDIAMDDEDGDINNGSLWNRVLNKINDDLPKYDELFPNKFATSMDKLKEMTMGDLTVLEGEQRGQQSNNNSSGRLLIPGVSSHTEDSSTGSSEDDDEALQIRLNRFFQQRQQFQNDRMLFFFWIPLIIVLVMWYTLFRFGHDNDFVHQVSELVPKYLRIGSAKVLFGNERMKAALREQLSNFQFHDMNINNNDIAAV